MVCSDRLSGVLQVLFIAAPLIAAALFTSSLGGPALAAEPIKLNGPLVTDGNVIPEGLQFSPDSSRVLYLADQLTDDVNEIFSVPSTGGLAIRLNGTLAAGGDVFSEGAQFSPDSSRVLYLADQTTNNVNEIFSVPSAGGMATKLNGTLVANGDVSSSGLQFSPDSSRVLYWADQTTDLVNEIFSVLSGGGVATKLNGPLVSSGDVSSSGLQFSPDSSRVLYLADQTTNNVSEIFSVPSEGGFATKLNGPLDLNGDVSSSGLQFSPDSSRVLYLADQLTNNVFEIFSVPSEGGVATRLNGPLVLNGDVSSAGLQFSPDSSRVLYLADQTTNDVDEIFSVPGTGGTATKLNGTLVDGGNVFPDGLQFSPDSSRVLYVADQTTNDVNEIFSVPSAGGTATRLNGALVDGGNVFSEGLQFSPDSNRVIYLADQLSDGVNEIFSVPSAGGMATKLNGTLVAGGNVLSDGLQFSPDSSRLIYLADQTTDNVNEIFIVPSGGGTAVKLNGPLVAGGNVSSQQISPDGSLVLYLADQNEDNVNEIFVRIVRQHSNSGDVDWDTGAAWDHGGEPDKVMQIFVDAPGTVTATGSTPRLINELVVGSSTETSTLALADGAEISTLHGATIQANGVLHGDGMLVADLVVAAGGIVRAGAAEQLVISGSTVSNEGLIEATGTTADPATIRFEGPVTNNGTLNVEDGSTAIFSDSLAGNGSEGSGEVQILGQLLPGTGPGIMNFGGDLILGSPANLEIELGGLTAGTQFDQLLIAGDTTLAGTLDVTLIDGFTLAAGQQFEILNVGGSLTGTFAGLPEGSLVGNFGGTNLFVSYSGGDGNDVTLLTALPGDFDQDGDVDGSDFLVWQRDPGVGSLTDWQAQHGSVLPLTANANTVPEPDSLLILAFFGSISCMWCRFP
ncbi:TolB-like translocation protein [Bythopirellula goksoeyrii]|uniref:Translocation protein TolB n=1 Tax=Bythopirellula goksoeyrii TaxID=1400387 RepID=A0A5B9Q7I7_9BACT|nr:hypothetical protein [Bythopirellula goksoeyrii]QEG33639.1 translocation protein TolB [Bythopirellula goksoeyrii]